mgnify:CR=1 FL=1
MPKLKIRDNVVYGWAPTVEVAQLKMCMNFFDGPNMVKPILFVVWASNGNKKLGKTP